MTDPNPAPREQFDGHFVDTCSPTKDEASQLDRELACLVAQHYVGLGWAVTPGYHDLHGNCAKHPSVRWKEQDIAEGKVIGPATNTAQARTYWIENPCGRLADICIHAKLSRLVVVDCDRSWKDIVVKDENGNRITKQVFVDGLATFLDFMCGDVGTELISRSKRGLHFFYRVDSERAAQITNRNGWLTGVDVRGGGKSSGGVTVETNGICRHRCWIRGVPRIEITEAHPEGEIVGVEDYEPVVFNDTGNCTGGLPNMQDDRVVGLRSLPENLLRTLLVASHVIQPSDSDLKNQHQQAKRNVDRLMRATTVRPESAEGRLLGDAHASAALRPYRIKGVCSCGCCAAFDEAKNLIAWIPPEVNYEAWRNVIWGLSDLLNGSKCGELLAAEWSNLSVVKDRRDPDQAKKIYSSDRRQLSALLGWDTSHDVGTEFLRGMATLCGGPDQSVSASHLRGIAKQHDTTLVTECGIDTDAVLRRELGVFEQLDPRIEDPAQASPVAAGDGSSSASPDASNLPDFGQRSGIQQTHECLGVQWGPLVSGTLDELLPSAPALLHYPTRRGCEVSDPYEGDTLTPMQEVGMLVAPGSSGKTMFFLQLLVAVATGTKFLRKFQVGTAAAHRPVVMVCGEDRREQILRRLQLIFRHELHDLSSEKRREAERLIHIVPLAGIGRDRLFLKTMQGIPEASDSFAAFAATIRKIEPSLVVCDPLSRLLSGNVDLSSEVGTAWVATLEQLTRKASKPMAVWFAHHSNKASRGSRLTSEDDEPEARGTTGLFDGVRVEGYVMALPDSEVAFRVRKNNHGPRMEFKDRELLVRGEHGLLRAFTDEELTEKVESKKAAKAAARDEDDTETLRRLLVALALNPKETSQDSLRSIVCRGTESVRRAFATLKAGKKDSRPMVTQAKKGGRFHLDGPAIAKSFPTLVDTARQVVVVGRWCTPEWPKGIREEDAFVPIAAPTAGDTDRDTPRSDASDRTQKERMGAAPDGSCSIVVPGCSGNAQHAPKGGLPVGSDGASADAHISDTTVAGSQALSDSESDLGRIAVRSHRGQEQSGLRAQKLLPEDHLLQLLRVIDTSPTPIGSAGDLRSLLPFGKSAIEVAIKLGEGQDLLVRDRMPGNQRKRAYRVTEAGTRWREARTTRTPV